VPRREHGIDALISDLLHSCPPPRTKNRNPDLTPFQRRYVSYVRRCDELERKLRFFGSECDNFGLNLETAGDIDTFLESNSSIVGARSGVAGKAASGTQLLESLEVELEGYESQLKELNAYSEKLTREYNEKVELQEVLEKARRFFMTDAPRLAVSELSTGRVSFRLILARSGMRGLLVYYIMHYAGANCSSS